MIEIMLMIGVIGWFAKTAKNKNKSKVLWGIIGALSYYIPVLFVSLFVFPLITTGWVNESNEMMFFVIGLFINIIAGIGGLLISKRILENADMSSKTKKIYVASIISAIVILLCSLFVLNYFKIKSGVAIYGFENMTGNQKNDKGDYVGAIEDFNKAIKRSPKEHSALYYNRGIAYEKLKEYDKAIIDFQKALQINKFKDPSQRVKIYYEIGNSYAGLRLIDSCIVYYKKVDKLNPNDDFIIFNIAFAYDYIGETEQACEYLTKVKIIPSGYEETYEKIKKKCEE